MPGSRLGPKQFAKFQSSDRAITFENDIWKSPGCFSDDKAPIAAWDKVLDGSVSEALESTWQWSQENFVDYLKCIELIIFDFPILTLFSKNGHKLGLNQPKHIFHYSIES